MKNTKKITKLILSAMLILALLAGCGGQQAAPPQEPDDEPFFNIGVINFMEHRALEAAFNGFVDALAARGYVDGENVSISYENAQGDMSNLSTIADRLVNRNVDMVLSITTPATQTIAGKTQTIPILGTAVTSYVVAGVIDSNEAPGGNVSGTSDMNPVALQIDMVVDLVPDVQTIGLIYNSSEANSVLQVSMAKERIDAIGLQWHEATVTNTGDVLQAMQSLVGRVEAIYIPACNTMASAMPAVHSVAMEAGVPTICGERNMVMEGGLATMGIDYYELGYATGIMAIDVLNGANPGDMPIQFAATSDVITINGLVAEEIGFVVPQKFAGYVVFPED